MINMGKGYRQGRLGEEIRKIIGGMLVKGMKDPRLSGMLSISAVEVTSDGSYATCFVSVLSMNPQDEESRKKEEEDVIAGLYSAKGLFKREIGKQVKLRHIPELIFKIDESMNYGHHISQIIDTLGIENYQSDEDETESDGEVVEEDS